MTKIVVYGTTWCPDCTRAKRILQQAKLEFEWVNIEENADGAALVKQANRGMLSVPTIVFDDGSTIVEPSNAQLMSKLKAMQLA